MTQHRKCCEGGVVGIWCDNELCTGSVPVSPAQIKNSKEFYTPTPERQAVDERMDNIARNGNNGEHYDN